MSDIETPTPPSGSAVPPQAPPLAPSSPAPGLLDQFLCPASKRDLEAP